MITKETLERLKMTPKHLKPLFTSKKPSPGIVRLNNLLRDRTREGRLRNLRDYRVWWAMDVAYDAPFRQITPTILQSFIDKLKTMDFSSVECLRAAEQWGLTQFISTRKTESGECKALDVPVMFKVIIPLTRAYLHIRWAKLFNDRDLHPLLKYEPAKFTAENRARCEIITDRIEFMGQQLGFRSTLKQWIFNALHYGTSIMFPREDWFVEKECEYDDNGKESEVITKEGLRYNIPHPSRVFYDETHRIGTINSDSGTEFAGYWRIARYRDVEATKTYWNTDKISMFRSDLIGGNQVFFSTVYPCIMAFPTAEDAGGVPTGAGEMDRERHATFYTHAHEDRAVVLADVFCKMRPADYDLGKYKNPIWFRFVMANDSTVLYCAPLCYTPPLYIGYDPHEERERNASLTLEILPFQDQMSNLLAQTILTAKSNLARAVFVNSDMVPQQYIDRIENMGENFYRALNFIPYSNRKANLAGNDVRQAFTAVQFPLASTVELVSTFRLLLDVLERILVYSAQEVGAVAAHEQTAEESRLIAGNVSNRLQLTNSFIDDAVDAWKNQLYKALMAYGTEEIWAQIPAVPPVTNSILEKMGFTVDETGQLGIAHKIVRGSKKALRLEGFASSRDAQDRINNPEIASSMAQLVQMILSNPITAPAIGAQQAIDLFNIIAKIAGLPRDFKLVVANPDLAKRAEQGGMPDENKMKEMLMDLTKNILDRSGQQTMNLIQQTTGPVIQSLQKTQSAVQGLQTGQQELAKQVQPLQIAVENVIVALQKLTGAAASENATQSGATEQPAGAGAA